MAAIDNESTQPNLFELTGEYTQITSIGGPSLVEGQLQTYEVVALEGTARLVQF